MVIYQVDAFTDKAFKGNPAGVLVLDSEISTDLMQSIANEMNLSETAFVIPAEDHYLIRYFTPAIEVPICGHATLASSHILYTQGFAEIDSEIIFKARIDDLTATYDNGWIKMSFPRFGIEKIEIPGNLHEVIGVKVSEFYVDKTKGWNLAFIDNKYDLRDLVPDFEKIKRIIPELLIVTSEDKDGKYDFLVRCFAPNAGISEDPVTGAANCMLSTFWRERLKKDAFISRQQSARTGIIKTKIIGNRVEISGQAITVFKAEMTI